MKIKISILSILLGITLTGCSNNLSNDKSDDISSKSDKVQVELKKSEEKSKDLEQEVDESEDANTESVDIQEKKQLNDQEKSTFIIYTADANDTNKIMEFLNFKIDENKSLKEKPTELCFALQKEYFKDDKAEIQLKSIDNGIATVNLKNRDAWNQKFAGSTGGIISQTTITETLLQKQYTGEWIKGLKILVDGESNPVFDHASFDEIIYR